ncbi:MAG: hypothetical protein L6Q57_03765 [Alphaproteobacteria bacterium]|nr:hypothetical protein [Alphaproteobacteria bacterium]
MKNHFETILDLSRILKNQRWFFEGTVTGIGYPDPTQPQLPLTYKRLRSYFHCAVRGVLYRMIREEPHLYDIQHIREWTPKHNRNAICFVFSERAQQNLRELTLRSVQFLCNGPDRYYGALGRIRARSKTSPEAAESKLLDEAILCVRSQSGIIEFSNSPDV